MEGTGREDPRSASDAAKQHVSLRAAREGLDGFLRHAPDVLRPTDMEDARTIVSVGSRCYFCLSRPLSHRLFVQKLHLKLNAAEEHVKEREAGHTGIGLTVGRPVAALTRSRLYSVRFVTTVRVRALNYNLIGRSGFLHPR